MQLLEGTRNKLQLLESTELAHSFEDPCFLYCILSAQFVYQNLICHTIAKIAFLIMGLWEFFLKQRNLSQLDSGLSCFSHSKSKWLKCHFYQSLTKLTDNQTKSIFFLKENFHLSMLKLMFFSTTVWNFDQDWPWLTHILTSFFYPKKKDWLFEWENLWSMS